MNSNLKDYCDRLDRGVDDVRKLSKQFCEKLGVTVFAYVRVYNDGRTGWVTSDGDQDRMLLESKCIQEEPFLDTQEGLIAGRYIWFNDREFPGCEAFYNERATKYQMDHGLILVNHKKDYLETCCFSGSLEKKPLQNLFLNETGLFYAFMEHFKKVLTPRLQSLIEEGLHISDMKPCYGKSSKLEDRDSLIKLCGHSRLLLLTPREKECLKWLRKGYTYEMIGEALGLSERTVEHYLDAVKNKLSLETRSELFEIAEWLEQLKV